jgi:hypothetical protein
MEQRQRHCAGSLLRPARRLSVKFNERELRRPINGNEEIEPALDSLHFGDIDMEEADRIDLELPFW